MQALLFESPSLDRSAVVNSKTFSTNDLLSGYSDGPGEEEDLPDTFTDEIGDDTTANANGDEDEADMTVGKGKGKNKDEYIAYDDVEEEEYTPRISPPVKSAPKRKRGSAKVKKESEDDEVSNLTNIKDVRRHFLAGPIPI
jgi:hypothetical protein